MGTVVGLDGIDMADLRRQKTVATQRLLGDTISIADTDWTVSTELPGWTRAHIATHVARNADATSRRIDQLGAQVADTGSVRDDKVDQLEAGARRTPLEIQIDLDTSAGRLTDNLNRIQADQLDPASAMGAAVWELIMARLNEVVMHHIDLDIGFGFGQLDEQQARTLLEWNVARRTDLRDGPGISVTSNSGFAAQLGRSPYVTEVSGSDASLLGWITGRLSRDAVNGAQHVSLGPPR